MFIITRPVVAGVITGTVAKQALPALGAVQFADARPSIWGVSVLVNDGGLLLPGYEKTAALNPQVVPVVSTFDPFVQTGWLAATPLSVRLATVVAPNDGVADEHVDVSALDPSTQTLLVAVRDETIGDDENV
jgi:hypothetical protein